MFTTRVGPKLSVKWSCESHALMWMTMCRTPVGLRALSRCYVALLIPVFFGPYYANLHRGIGTAFAVIIAIVVSRLPNMFLTCTVSIICMHCTCSACTRYSCLREEAC